MATTLKGDTTKLRVLAAAVDELREVGPSRLRLQGVAERAGVTISTVANIFDGRESLIAAAIVTRVSQISDGLFEETLGIMEGNRACPATLIEHIADPHQVRARTDARKEFVALASMATSNEAASRAVAAITLLHRTRLLAIGEELYSEGLLAKGVTPRMFIRVYMGLLYGQTVFDDRGGYEVGDDEWSDTMRLVVTSLFAPHALWAKEVSTGGLSEVPEP